LSQKATDPDAFREFEAAGWEKVGDPYHHFWGPITGRVIDPLLDDAKVGRGSRVLDVATGPGYVAGRAAERGASVVGIDIAHQMVTLARTLHPAIEFRQGDVEDLPFPDNSFDAVVANFGVLHFGRPERAAAECARVLKPRGSLALSVWDVPERVRILGVFVSAVQEAGAAPPSDIPPGPPFFRFSSDDEFTRLLTAAGLKEINVRRISFTHRVPGVDELWNGGANATVRTSALILRQTPETQRRIRAAFDRLVQEYAVDEGLELPVSVKLASGLK